MDRIVYLNGDYLPEKEAKISVFDRGFLFADGVYEVVSVLEGKLVDFDGHTARLNRSLNELDMQSPCSDDELLAIHRELIARTNLEEGMIYLQVTRGVEFNRSFDYPAPDVEPTLMMFPQVKALVDSPYAKKGMSIISQPDIRWKRRDIKTIQLLAPSMAKMAGKPNGADDTWMIEDGFVTEGTSNNAYIIKDQKIITRPVSNDILKGITRTAVLRFAQERDMKVDERTFTIDEAKEADEAFLTSATTFVMPVVSIDGHQLGDGTPGEMTKRLREIYIEESRKAAI